MFKKLIHSPTQQQDKSADALLSGDVAPAPYPRRHSIRTRLTFSILIITAAILTGTAAFIISRTSAKIEADANADLKQNNESLKSSISTWLDLNLRALHQMALLPDIVNMQADEQKPVLKAMAATHPYMYLVSTTDLSGMNVARNDDAKLTDYSDRFWFQNAKAGALFTFQSLIGRTTGKPALVVSTPVRDSDGKIIGVVMFAADLTNLSEQTRVHVIGQSGYTYIVDDKNKLLAHPDPAYTTDELRDFSEYPPVIALRQGKTGLITFTDENGVRWRAYVDALDNGWGVIAQQPEGEILASVYQFRIIVFTAIAVALLVIFLLSWFAIRSALLPIGILTETAIAIAGGDLQRVVEVDSQDEVGALASAFNRMTAQLRDLVGTLEQRVAERTRGLELAADVGRSVSQVRALDVMLQEATEIIRSRFDLYYVQVYLADEKQGSLVLKSGTGDVGEELLARQHRLPLDANSINGRAAVEKRSVVVSNTAESSFFKPNPLLPDTCSEMAVPLIVGEAVVGVLDMQSSQPGALSEQALPAFEALAGQLAIAIQNARLLEETDRARAEVEAQARRLVRANWQEYLDALHMPEQIGFTFEAGQVVPVNEPEPEPPAESTDGLLTAPIDLTGEVIGALVVELDPERQTAQNRELIQAVARQLAQKLEGLRLLESAERYRLEAEEAARRLTREGWEEYLKGKRDESLAYLYDLTEVRPARPQAVEAEAALTLPLKVREETIGKLAVLDFESAQPEDLELVTAVAERLSEHLERLRLFEETQRGQMELDKRARQLAAVSRISTVSAQELDVQKMLASVVQLTQREFGLYHAHVFIYNELAQQLEIVACGWEEGSEHAGTHEEIAIPIDQEQSLVARAARTRLPVVVNDVRSDPGWLPNPLLPETAAELAVPLVIADQVLGVLDVQSERVNAFSEEDINIQATLAAQVATALQNARSFERAQRQAEREALLNAISQKIQSATSVEAVLQIAARELGHALGAARTIAQLSLKDTP